MKTLIVTDDYMVVGTITGSTSETVTLTNAALVKSFRHEAAIAELVSRPIDSEILTPLPGEVTLPQHRIRAGFECSWT